MMHRVRRIWFHFPLALRMYLAVVTFIGAGGIGWLGVRIYRREAVIHEIERVGGRYGRVAGGPAGLPGWARSGWVGLAFDDIEWVDLREGQFRGEVFGIPFDTPLSNPNDPQPCDQTLARLATCDRLKSLTLGETPITDAGLVHLQRMANLAGLDLGGTRITDS